MSLTLHTPEEKLAAITNHKRTQNSEPVIDFSEYVFHDPKPFTGVKNTCIYASPLLHSLYTGMVELFYDRVDLATVQNYKVTKGSATKIHDLIDQINEKLGLRFKPEDFADGDLPSGGGFTLTATAKNKIYTGSTTIAYNV